MTATFSEDFPDTLSREDFGERHLTAFLQRSLPCFERGDEFDFLLDGIRFGARLQVAEECLEQVGVKPRPRLGLMHP